MSHTCTHFLLRCMDFRLESAFENWLKERGYLGDIDVISIPGSCKVISDNPQGCQAEFILGGIRLAYDKHGVRIGILTQHQDCGAYGGEAAFVSPEAAKLKLLNDMNKVQQILQETYSDLQILKFWVKQTDNGWQLEEITF